MHWLFLIIGYQLQQSSFDTISNMPDEYSQLCVQGYESGQFTRIDSVQFFSQCLTQPLDKSILTQGIDPVTLLVFWI